ncbi:hypothetical protein UFOVP80_37 [uncultured Caudovirales phage]|uniref:Helix-turn-helix domain containing protein n=1 Tax=uncultured Caudovirales phage TaxID=2100421 RepID=A0A6J5KZ19_9CAUD|nr:hypothetical protein UFOVP80_37 [uncultured Caudovirales phage]
MTEEKSIENRLEEILGSRQLYSPAELVKKGFFKKSTLHGLIRSGAIEAYYTSERRLVIPRESVMHHLVECNMEV